MKAHSETHFENENIQDLYQLTLAAAAVGKVRSFLKAHCWKREREREMFAFPKHSKVCVHCRVVIWHTHMWAFQMTD